MEHTRAKWARYGGHMANAKGEYNLIIIQTFFGCPLQLELSKFHCIWNIGLGDCT